MGGTFDVQPAPRARMVIVDVGASSTDSLHGTLGRLAAERSRYTVAHELAHHVLADIDGCPTGMADTGKTSTLLALLRLVDEIDPALLSVFADVALAPDASLDIPSAWPSRVAGLPSWRSGVLPKSGFKDSPIEDSVAPTVAEPVLSVTPASVATLPWAEVRRFIEYLARLVAKAVADIAVAAIRQIDKVRAAVCAELARRVALLARNPGVCAFMLIILAVCRRYGRRAEPDDPAVSPIRRYPTFRGVAACA